MLRHSIHTGCRSAAMFVRVCLLVGLLGASARHSIFNYKHPDVYRRANDVCKICYGIDCLELDHARCEYYVETEGLVHESDEEKVNNPEIRADVDNMMYTLLEKAGELASECIPLVSSYTDCQKENVCIGCRTCECDGAGRWNCSVIQKCRADPTLDINHRILFMVMENLMNNGQSNRLKRSVQDKSNGNTKLSFEEISEWLYGVHPGADQAQITTTEESQHNVTDTVDHNEATTEMEYTKTNKVTIKSTIPDTISDHDYLAFDEVLNSIAVESKNYTKKKPAADARNETAFFDYMMFDEINETDDFKGNDEFVTTSNAVDLNNYITESNGKGVTAVVFDLLESSKRNNIIDDLTDYMDVNETNNYLDPVLENNNDLEFNAVNIMKRDAADENNPTIEKLNTNEDDNLKNSTIELKNDVLLPLSNLINAKQNELEDLLRISENLIKFMKFNKNEDTDVTLKENKSEIDTNESYNIYKLEIVPQVDYAYDLRRTNTNILDFFLYKMKRDVYEVIKDIVSIQKYTNLTKLPQDLKILIRAMKSYVDSQKNYLKNENMLDADNENRYSRRQLDTSNTQYPNTIIDDLVNILETVNKNRPESKALASLSDNTKKIVKRIIKQNYVNEFAESGLRVFDPNYNLTNDLESIGLKWQDMTKYVAKSTVFDRLYAMKLLHFVLSVDMNKMNDALALIRFTHSRRMSPIDGRIGNAIIEKINKGLEAINDKLKIIIKFHNKGIRPHNSTKTIDLNKKIKKDSFFKKVRNILRNSKKDIVSLMQRKVPKEKLVKELAKKKLDDITRRRFTEFEETMKIWQTNLDLTPREKRSLREMKLKNRIKNILPKYLRGKVNPAIVANNMKNNNLKQKMKKTPNKKIATITARTVLGSTNLNTKKDVH